jgi:broad specificity phosphatase PhoE
MKPQKIILVRHGESEGNVDKSVYLRLPDYAVSLTKKGISQARKAGKELKKITKNPIFTSLSRVFFYVSPFKRTRQTFEEIAKSFERNEYEYREDPRLIEQMWSGRPRKETGFDEEQEKEREGYGSFYYRFDGGENIVDCFVRVSSFLDTLFRDFEKKDFPENVVIVAHGMLNRAFLMRWFHLTVEEFELLANPKNCEIIVLELDSFDGKYYLEKPLRKYSTPTHPHQFPIKLKSRE